MSAHHATVVWERNGQSFLDGKYRRAHIWRFDGGTTVPASASPTVVPAPYSMAEAIDPEEAFVASLSSCHMLWFLDLARRAKLVVDAYEDDAEGTLAKDEAGRLAILEVVLRPRIAFGGDRRPSLEELEAIHQQAHDKCFIANSVKTKVKVEAR